VTRDVVIVSAVRTPVGKFQGALSEIGAVELGALVVREAVRRAGISAELVDECVMGCVLPAGLGQNPARQAALRGGLCGHGERSDHQYGMRQRTEGRGAGGAERDDGELGDCRGRRHGVHDQRALPLAAGAQGLSPGRREGGGFSDQRRPVVRHGRSTHGDDRRTWWPRSIPSIREMQDAYALESHRRAAAAWSEGRFDAEVLPVELPTKNVDGTPDDLSAWTRACARTLRWKRWPSCDRRSSRMGR
jgi:acetyl-CoA C-acetyltransferase